MNTAKAGDMALNIVKSKWFWIAVVIIIVLVIVYKKGKKTGSSENELAGAYGSTTAGGFDPRGNVNKLATAIQQKDFAAVDKQCAIIAGWGEQLIRDGNDWWNNKYAPAYGSMSDVLKQLSTSILGLVLLKNIDVLYKKLENLGL